MSLFRRHGDVTYADLSNDLRDAALDWKPDVLRAFDYPTDVTCVACLPGLFLAIGSTLSRIQSLRWFHRYCLQELVMDLSMCLVALALKHV